MLEPELGVRKGAVAAAVAGIGCKGAEHKDRAVRFGEIGGVSRGPCLHVFMVFLLARNLFVLSYENVVVV